MNFYSDGNVSSQHSQECIKYEHLYVENRYTHSLVYFLLPWFHGYSGNTFLYFNHAVYQYPKQKLTP